MNFELAKSMILLHFRKILLFKVSSLIVGVLLLARHILGQAPSSHQPTQLIVIDDAILSGDLTAGINQLAALMPGPIGIIGGSASPQRIVAPTDFHAQLTTQAYRSLSLQPTNTVPQAELLDFAHSHASPGDGIWIFEDGMLQPTDASIMNYVQHQPQSAPQEVLLLALIFILLGL